MSTLVELLEEKIREAEVEIAQQIGQHWSGTPMMHIHQSETTTYARCQRLWYYRYKTYKDQPSTPSTAMVKGTLWHAYLEEWWAQDGGHSEVDFANVLANAGDDAELLTEQIADDIMWMAERYDQWRGGGRENTDWIMLDQELELIGTHFDLALSGRVDGLVRDRNSGEYYLLERKTMRDWRRLDYLTVDPQINHYLWLAERNDIAVVGVVYEAAKTYRWSRDEHKHPPSDSFQEHLVVRSPEQIEAYIEQVHAFELQRSHIHSIEVTVPSIGQNCLTCEFKGECWDSLGVPAEPHIEFGE